MPPRWNENRLTAKLGIDDPVIQVRSADCHQKLTAAVSTLARSDRLVRTAWLRRRSRT